MNTEDDIKKDLELAIKVLNVANRGKESDSEKMIKKIVGNDELLDLFKSLSNLELNKGIIEELVKLNGTIRDFIEIVPVELDSTKVVDEVMLHKLRNILINCSYPNSLSEVYIDLAASARGLNEGFSYLRLYFKSNTYSDLKLLEEKIEDELDIKKVEVVNSDLVPLTDILIVYRYGIKVI